MRPLILLTSLLLAACGQAGDLYLPAEPPAPAAPETVAPGPADVSVPADQKKKD
ncbi:MAG TPA: lipoprotein [Verrucomicrobiae bacterium]|nr:lipoprotein [Verrucomicrobiae bacterium]